MPPFLKIWTILKPINECIIVLFCAPRLGFRNWLDSDLSMLAEINSDPRVMEFFPGVKTREESYAFIERMKKEFDEKGFCYFAVDKLDNAI